MNLSVGIVGLPNIGKSTLFNALIKRQLAKVAEYPFTTIEPHEGVIDIPDERLTTLTSMINPEKSTPAAITFIDIAGLVKGAHKGEGLGNEFLGHIKEVDAILHVVRAFEHLDAAHPLVTIDPERDIEIINMELILKDLETVNKLVEKEKNPEIKNHLIKIKNHLDSGKMVKDLSLSEEEKTHLSILQFLTAKPMFYVLNISEKELAGERAKKLEEKDFLVVCAKLEADLTALSAEEQKEYLESLKITSSSLEKVLKEAYDILDLITFFTIKGGKEVRAWPIPKGSKTIDAAGCVHTDFARGFIKADLINYADFVKIGGWHVAHEQGKIHTVGKDHVIADGDIIEFKFNV